MRSLILITHIFLDTYRDTIRVGCNPRRWNGTRVFTQELNLSRTSLLTGSLTGKPALPPFERPPSRCPKVSWEAHDLVPGFAGSRGRGD